tara:strand:+ start:367 stop:1935 length:1569 start_codon:yes stop_codon:yes gene_type:complete
MDKNIKFYHKDWIGNVFIKDDKLFRDNNKDENGVYIISKSEILVNWINWEKENYLKVYKNIYIEEKYLSSINIYFLIDRNSEELIIYDNEKNEVIENESVKMSSDSIIFNDNLYVIFKKNIFILSKDLKYYFSIEALNFNKKNTYILNKYNNNFFEIDDIFNKGLYEIDNNILILKWDNGITKQFLSDVYHEKTELNYENIKIIRPKNFIINEKVLFSNISLIKRKIYLTSIYYSDKPWDIKEIIFKIKNNKIIKNHVIEYKHYESCIIIELELEKEEDNIDIEIEYIDYKKTINLKQLVIPKKNIYAVTLFKDDYQLLKKYLEYYKNLGVDCFFLYYNDKITENFINEIDIINQSKHEIILIEWTYDYWYYYKDNVKHHHSQVMAINDSLNILKNFSNYVLYNDLDEYIKLDYNFKELIEKNKNVDIFEFKCLFCKMGEELIKYRNFYFEYNDKNIIKGNFWDKFREKNLIKLENINLMGVHNVVYDYSKIKLNKLYISYFYHFINFYEKNRLELMTQYIS